MAEFLADPSVLTKEKLKSVLLANNVTLPNGEQKKGVYVELYLKNLTSQNKKSASMETFSSDEELAAPTVSSRSRSSRKATRKTDRVHPFEVDVTELTNDGLKDQLLKYGISAGPIVASTRKLYEKKLQRLLDQGLPETVVLVSESIQTDSSRNGSADSEQYSDKEEEWTTVVPEVEPEPDLDPLPVVEKPLRSRGKTTVSTRQRSTQHKREEENLQEDLQALNVQRKSRSSHRLDRIISTNDDPNFSKLLASDMLPDPQEKKRPLAIPNNPTSLISDKQISTDKADLSVKNRSPRSMPSSTWQQGRKLSDTGMATSADLCTTSDGKQKGSQLNTALLEAAPDTQFVLSSKFLNSGAVGMFQGPKSGLTPGHTKQSSKPFSAFPKPSRDLIHVMCRLSPLPAKDSPKAIEKLSAVEQTPKTPERDVLKEMFPYETLNTPTGISATPRQPIKGAAGRPFNDLWLDNLRPRLSEFKHTSSSYVESRSVPRVSAIPLSATKLTVPQSGSSVQVKTRRRLPMWVQLLLLSAVAGFLFFVYQAMESNEINPFGQPGSSKALGK